MRKEKVDTGPFLNESVACSREKLNAEDRIPPVGEFDT